MDVTNLGPLFRWETLQEVGPLALTYRPPTPGRIFAVELTSGPIVRVFRADDGEMYFCHGLTFGGKEAPGGPISPFSGLMVKTILENHYQPVLPESAAQPDDDLVWRGLDDETPHSAVLVEPVIAANGSQLDGTSQVRTKNGRMPEEIMSLERLTGEEFGYGDSFAVYRRRRYSGDMAS